MAAAYMTPNVIFLGRLFIAQITKLKKYILIFFYEFIDFALLMKSNTRMYLQHFNYYSL